MSRRYLGLACLVIAVLVAIACGDDGDDDGLLTTLEIARMDGSSAKLRVEIADTRAERVRGLANRASLAADRGMLFVIEQRSSGFWMKDVAFDLSVAFLARCGEILDIQDMEAGSLELHQSATDYRFGLEVNRGWFAAAGLGVGDAVILPPGLTPTDCS